MAILTKTALLVKYDSKETDKDGNVIFKQVKFSNLNNFANDDQLLAVGDAVGALLDCEDNFHLQKYEHYVMG